MDPTPCDFEWWARVMDSRPLTLWEAACLWAGIDPRRTKSHTSHARHASHTKGLTIGTMAMTIRMLAGIM